jgi:hypothetical protein
MTYTEAAIELAKFWDRNAWSISLRGDRLVKVVCHAFGFPVPPRGSPTWIAIVIAYSTTASALHDARKRQQLLLAQLEIAFKST